jgi:predicted nucleic acid-binding protein
MSPCLLDSDTLSNLAREQPKIVRRARMYLAEHGRLTFSAVTVFERLRGYRTAMAEGKPYGSYMEEFETLCRMSRVLPVDTAVAACAAMYWAALSTRARRNLGDILIAATASVYGLELVTHNRKDFEPIVKLDSNLKLQSWAR